MRSRLFIAALGLSLSVCGGGVAHAVVPPGNVLVNPGAEDGAASLDGGPVPVPGWVTEGGFTVVAYGTPGTPPRRRGRAPTCSQAARRAASPAPRRPST